MPFGDAEAVLARNRLPLGDLLGITCEPPASLPVHRGVELALVRAERGPEIDPPEIDVGGHVAAEVREVCDAHTEAAEAGEDRVGGLAEHEPPCLHRERAVEIDLVVWPEHRVHQLDAEDRGRRADDWIGRDARHRQREQRSAQSTHEVEDDEAPAPHLRLHPRSEEREGDHVEEEVPPTAVDEHVGHE